MQTMNTTYQSQGLEIIAVNLDKNRDLAEAFLDKVKVDFMVAFDQKGEIAATYELRGMPTSYLIGRDGKIYATHIGFREKDKPKLEQIVQQLLNQ
jgi:cytochrome c biogenesis protein CcmG/thiol:disulfide interchange protein DsbE